MKPGFENKKCDTCTPYQENNMGTCRKCYTYYMGHIHNIYQNNWSIQLCKTGIDSIYAKECL